MVEVIKVDDGHVVEINENEALELIKSLSSQLLSKSSNAGRIEFGQPYFTIAVKFLSLPQCNLLKSECERCGKDFSNDDLDIYNDELLCDNCIDEVKDEQGTPHDF